MGGRGRERPAARAAAIAVGQETGNPRSVRHADIASMLNLASGIEARPRPPECADRFLSPSPGLQGAAVPDLFLRVVL